MKLSEAVNHASTIFVPDFALMMGDDYLKSDRAVNEEAIGLLVDTFFESDQPGFTFDLVLDLCDRNRETCDAIEDEEGTRSANLPRSLSDDDLVRGIAALQHRKPASIARSNQGASESMGVMYASGKISGTVLGIDIETTSTSPDRGRIINVGWGLMDLAPGAQPYDTRAVYCGLPECYASAGVPLENIHHISWNMLEGKTSFREDAALQTELLDLMTKYPYLAHNAAFEDAWFTFNLTGYAEARKKHAIVPVDTRDICRSLDPEVKRLPWDTHPASLEAWAKRRGTLAAGEVERHLGLEDTELMLATVLAEFMERNLL